MEGDGLEALLDDGAAGFEPVRDVEGFAECLDGFVDEEAGVVGG